MKKLNVALAILVTAVMAGNAQTNAVTSDIVGYQNYNVVVGLNAVGVSLINADTLKGTVSGATGSTVSITGQTNVGSLLTSGEPYYIEVYSGSSKGDRFDVDTAGTIASASGNVVLLPASANNSRSYTSTSIAAGSVVALRKHVTLEQLKNSVSSGSWFGSNTFTSADQVQILDPLTQAFTVYYLRGNGTDWRGTSTGTTIQNKAVIPPGKGVFIDKKSAPITLSVAGSVRNNDFAMPYYAGLDLKAPPVPMTFSPSTLGGIAANGWYGNNAFASADQIQIFDAATQAFTTYYLRGNGTDWRGTSTGTTIQTTTGIVTSDSAYLVSRKNADLTGYLVNPLPQN